MSYPEKAGQSSDIAIERAVDGLDAETLPGLLIPVS
jgi:hypothetical protein